MGRYIGVPDSLVSEIENIIPVASRYNNRTVYTTPGAYTFTVPAGVTQITAVAVGPGGKPCTIIESMITCGKLQCIAGFIAACKWYYTDATCPAHCRPACNPLDATCVCTFDTCRTYCWHKCTRPMYLCRCSSMAAGACDSHIICMSSFDQTMRLVHLPSGGGGGYSEKMAATTAGSQYCIIVGQDCNGTSPNSFSCVNGLNISICATAPKSYSDAANTEVLGSNDRYFFDSVTSTWRCLSPKHLFNVRTTSATTVASPPRCIGCLCLCGNRANPCYCTVTTWNLCVAAGQGFGGDINRTGGFCCTIACLALSQIPNTACYPYAQKIKDCKFGPTLCGTIRCCFMGCADISDGNLLICAYCQSNRSGVAPVVECCSDCNCVGTAFFYRCIVGNCAGGISSTCDLLALNNIASCFSAFRFECHQVCGAFSQHLREVGDSNLCVTNFDVYAPGTHNPYCAIIQNVNLLTLGQDCYGTCLNVCCLHCLVYCNQDSTIGYVNSCAPSTHSISIDWGDETTRAVWNPSCMYRCMNCDLNAGANSFARYKFGGSSAGNYYRNGVSALNDDNTYVVNCNSGFGHCASSPYSCPCNWNRAIAFAAQAHTTSQFNRNLSNYGLCHPFVHSWTCYCCSGGVQNNSGFGSSGLQAESCCIPAFFGYFAQKYLGDECAWKAYCTLSGLTRTMNDTLRLNLPQGLTQCSQFTNDEQHAWTGFHNWYSSLMFAGFRMCLTSLGSGSGANTMYENGGINGYFICIYNPNASGCVYLTCAKAPAPKTCLKYFTTIVPQASTRLDCCGNSGTGVTVASYCGGPNVLLCVVPVDGSIGGGTISRCSFVCHHQTCVECFASCYHCRVVGINCYWPCAVNYNFCTTSCRVTNLNPLINLYDYICSSYVGCAGCCAETCAGINTHYDHESVFESTMPFDASEALTAFYYPDTAVVGTRCCVYKSSDKVTINDRHYLAQYTASMNWCMCLLISSTRANFMSESSQCYCRRLIAMLAGVCANYAKCTSIRCCDLSTNIAFAQGGAGIGTAGIWGEGVVTCTLLSSGGGNIKCLVPCCNVQYCFCDAAAPTAGLCTIPRTIGHGLTPGTAAFKIVDTTAAGSGATIQPIFAGLNCCSGTALSLPVAGGSGGTAIGGAPFSTICYGFGSVPDFFLVNCGFGYSSANGAVVMCTEMDWCTYAFSCTRAYINALYGGRVGYCCGCWVPTAGSNRCPDFCTTNGCVGSLTVAPGPSIIPHFCVLVQPSYANYSCVASTYSEGSGGGSKIGQAYCAKYSTIIDSPTIVSIIPGRGGRGNESPYEPYYYSYPGISARLSTPRPPGNYVGDPTTGCSWFDTPQINGSGGNGMFCSANFSCIFVQCAGPGGGGANGARADGTLCPNGGVLGGGAGCCGLGGNGGGSGWGITANGAGMVVMYWNA